VNPRTTAILFGVALVLGAFLYFYEIRGEEARKEAEQAEKAVFPGVDAGDVVALQVETGEGGAARLESRDAGWRVTSPVDFPADEAAADGMASTLAKLTAESRLESPEEPDVYGLGEGARVLRFETGEEGYELRVGGKTPVGANSYVSRSGDPRVHLVPTWRLNSLQKSLDELRDRRVLDFDRDAVAALELSWPGGGVALEEREEGWWLTAPREARADGDAVEDLLSELAFLRAEGFVDAPPPDAEAGLEAPAFAATLVTRAAEGEEAGRRVRFALGSDPADGERLARGQHEGVLYRVPAERLSSFPRDVVAYRFKELSEFAFADARRFEIRFREPGGEALTIEGRRGDAGWDTGPEPMAAGLASDLVSELSQLDGVSIAVESPGREDLEALGLAPPRASFRVYGPSQEGDESDDGDESDGGDAGHGGGQETVLAHVELGRVDPDRGIAARAGGSGPVYRIEADLAEHLPVSLEAYRNRFVSREQAGEAAEPGAAADEGAAGGGS